MIDTVKLTLGKGLFWVMDQNRFEKGKTNTAMGYTTYVINPTKAQLKGGIYLPRLTRTNRFNTSGRNEDTLSIELSLPKLMYGNNFDELTTEDFESVITKLKQALLVVGVKVFTDILVNAPVSAVHYSKNIPLTDGSTPHYLISKIKEANISTALDGSQTNYDNGGLGYKWHCNSYEIAFYDKLKDLENAKKRGDKRAVEKDSAIQLTLFEEARKVNRFEVLRMEVRLNNRQKIKQIFKKLGIENDLTFKQVFNQAVSKKILLNYVAELDNKRHPLLSYKGVTTKDTLADIVINNPNLKPLKTLQLIGLKTCLEDITPRQLRSVLGKHSDRSWYRLIAETKKIKTPKTDSPFITIIKSLEEFKPLKLVDFNL